MDPDEIKIREELMKIAKDIKESTTIPDPWHKGDDKWKVELRVFVPAMCNNIKIVEVWEYRIFTEDDFVCARELHIDVDYITATHKEFKDVFVFDYNQQ